MKKPILLILTILTAVAWSARAEMRIWTDKKGNTIEAEFVDLIAGKVVLKTVSGAKRKFPASGFCQADQEYLKNAIPPEIEIEVDIDTNTSSVKRSGDYSDDMKCEKIKGSVTLTKKNRNPSSKKFTATLYVLTKHQRKEKLKVIDKSKHEFSFATQDKVVCKGSQVTTHYVKSYYWSPYGDDYENYGEEYEGYLVVVENDQGKVISIKGSRSKYEEMMNKIRKCNKGSSINI